LGRLRSLLLTVQEQKHSANQEQRRHVAKEVGALRGVAQRLHEHDQAVRQAGLADPLRLGVTVGPITVRLEEELVLEPDLVFVRQDRMSIVDPEGHRHGPPDLVVAILSPSRKHYDRTLKRKRYLDSGGGEVWIIDIDERMVEVWRPESQKPEQVREVLLWRVDDHAFEIPLLEVFREL